MAPLAAPVLPTGGDVRAMPDFQPTVVLRLLAAGTLAAALGSADAAAQQAVIVVRHAEKADQSSDALLSAEGLSRAKALAGLLRASGVTHIVTSEYRRTRETARPLAEALALTPETVPARDIPALVARLRALEATAIAVVVGHSNTIPPILRALGWSDAPDIGDGDYDDVFVLVPRAGQAASVVRLTYGRPTP
jgi:phosphohistidine phosphatase SixA